MLSWFRRKKQDNKKPASAHEDDSAPTSAPADASLAASDPALAADGAAPPPPAPPAGGSQTTPPPAPPAAAPATPPPPARPFEPLVGKPAPHTNQSAAYAATSWSATQRPTQLPDFNPPPFSNLYSPANAADPAAAATPPAAVETPAPPAATTAGTEPAAPVDTATDPAAAPPAAASEAGWRERLRDSGLARNMGALFARNPALDDDLLDDIETALLTADVGVSATSALVESLRKRMKAREFADANAVFAALRAELVALLRPVSVPLVIDPASSPFVILTIGVNGVGKTTTIGKLARRYRDEGRSVMLAAGDTFRAAAVAQLQAWGERNQVTVIAQGQNADAASVAFDALQAAQSRAVDVLIADTAGRLHTQQGLMAELGKIKRVLGKLDPNTPHEVLMVVDGTTGQNAVSQLRQFNAAAGVTGLVITKLDGTAKGGVVFALAREFGIPIRYAGIGEHPEDLRQFDPVAFVDALLPANLAT